MQNIQFPCFLLFLFLYGFLPSLAYSQPDSGQCQTFNWGGSSGLHYYTCCNNCDEIPCSCCGIEYDGASDGNYCGHCGNDLGDGDELRQQFDCDGCLGQSICLEACRDEGTIPGFCWKFTNCFEECCEVESSLSSQHPTASMSEIRDIVANTPFCGDYVCSETEDHITCPSDCCVQVNPEMCGCQNEGKECAPTCCGEKGCCLNNDDGRTASRTAGIVLPVACSVAAVGLAFACVLACLIPPTVCKKDSSKKNEDNREMEQLQTGLLVVSDEEERKTTAEMKESDE